MNNYRPSFLNSIPPVVKNLIAINIVLWLASMVIPGIFAKWGLNVDLTDILGLHYWESSKFNPAQLITYGFMHANLVHIFFNMFALYMFGGILEQVWGTKRFLFYYLLTGVGAAIVQELFWSFEYHAVIAQFNSQISSDAFNAVALLAQKKEFLNLLITVGASGSVFGLLLAFWWLFPDYKLFVFPIPIPIKARILIPLFALYELYSGYQMNPNDNVAHFAHLGGMLFGAILILIWKKKKTL